MSGKLALRYSGPALEAMKAVALAAKARSLADFQVTRTLIFKYCTISRVKKRFLGSTVPVTKKRIIRN